MVVISVITAAGKLDHNIAYSHLAMLFMKVVSLSFPSSRLDGKGLHALTEIIDVPT